MPIIDQKSFWENGYSLIKNLFDPEEVINIRKKSIAMAQRQLVAVGLLDKLNPELPEEEFNKLFFELFDKYPERIISTGKHIQHGMDLHRISLDKRIEEGLNDIGLSFPNICTRPMLFFNARKLAKKQVYWKTDPHQDWTLL
jgi:phytanoyl-CoA hydroxylase